MMFNFASFLDVLHGTLEMKLECNICVQCRKYIAKRKFSVHGKESFASQERVIVC